MPYGHRVPRLAYVTTNSSRQLVVNRGLMCSRRIAQPRSGTARARRTAPRPWRLLIPSITAISRSLFGRGADANMGFEAQRNRKCT